MVYPVPDHIPPNLVIEFDYFRATDGVGDPYQPLMDLDAAGAPDIFYSPLHGGHWVVRRYDDVSNLFRDAENFGTFPAGIPPQKGRVGKMLPFEADPADHARYRQILGPLFKPTAAIQMEGATRSTAVKLIENFADDGEVDFIDRFAAKLPSIVFFRLMDFPNERMEEFVELASVFLTSLERQVEAAEAINGIIREHYLRKIKMPGDDWVSFLIKAQGDDGNSLLSEGEIINMSFFLFLAGLDTVKNVLSHMWRYIAGDGDLQSKISGQKVEIHRLIEEMLRFFSVTNNNRWLLNDVQYKGLPFKKGDGVLMLSAVANRDPQKFERGDHIDLSRQVNPHLSLSAGAHRCLGANIARMELRVALEEWFIRIPQFRIKEGASVKSTGGGTMGLTSLPLVWGRG